MRIHIATIFTISLACLSVCHAEQESKQKTKQARNESSNTENATPVNQGVQIWTGGDLTAKQTDAVIAKFLTYRELVTTPVYLAQNSDQGHIEDFVVDTRTGRVRYAAIAFPDLLDPNMLFAMPLSSLMLDPQHKKLHWRIEIDQKNWLKLLASPRIIGRTLPIDVGLNKSTFITV